MDDLETFAPAVSDTQPSSPASVSHSQTLLPEDEFQEYIQKYPFAAEPTYFTRPNRYYGPASTWRSWTADDRAIADALDTLRSRDLSVHLYNAFALKQKGQQDPRPSNSRSRSKSKNETRSSAGNEASDDTFVPPQVWSAWPLRGRHVPREDRFDLTEASVLSGRDTGRMSTALESALIATTIRHAKEMWNSRLSPSPSSQFDRVKRDWKVEKDLTKQQLEHSGPLFDDTSANKQDDLRTIDTGSPSEISEAPSSPSTDLPEGIQTFSSQAFGLGDDSASDSPQSPNPRDEDDQPVFSADDDRLRRVLIPTTQHILLELDDLLVGLHKARSAYALVGNDIRSRSTRAVSGGNTTEDERMFRSGSRTPSKKKDRKRNRSDSSENRASSQDERGRSRGRSGTRRHGTNKQPLGLRDWSDVLGMATLTGWNIDVIARASERCAKLFDQNMMFRTFHENTGSRVNYHQQEPLFEEEYALAPAISEHNLSTTAKEEPYPMGSQPSPGGSVHYVRSSMPCSRCRLQKLRCKPPNIETLHSDTKITCAACAAARDTETACSGIVIKLMASDEPTSPHIASKICPYPTCARHISGKPFAKQYHLERHLKSMHGEQDPSSRDTSPRTPEAEHLALRPRLNHNGSMSCPLISCPQSTYRYSRATRLYEHIRHTHPMFDLEHFKKIASQGKKGKYDRSRSRSRLRVETQEGRDGLIGDGGQDKNEDQISNESSTDHKDRIDEEVDYG